MIKKRPKIALTCILKDEKHNLPIMLGSVSGCFDAIYLTDTGSTDGSIEWIKENAEKIAGCPIYLHHFEWVHDFSAARQYCLNQVTKDFDFVMWLDLDDILINKDAFLHFRDHSMHSSDAWLVNYNYAQDEKGAPQCDHKRERIVKNDGNWYWKYPIHEGLMSRRDDAWFQETYTWEVKHRRSVDDAKKDKGRNLAILEKHLGTDQRMNYYYGKELFDADQPEKSLSYLKLAILDKDTQFHDRLLAIQYAAQALIEIGKPHDAFQMGQQGILLDSQRAEFWCIMGDAMQNMQRPQDAKVYYSAAMNTRGSDLRGLVFKYKGANSIYPLERMLGICLQQGEIDSAKFYFEMLPDDLKPKYEAALRQVVRTGVVNEDATPVDDIVISSPPFTVCPGWDEDVLKEKGLGGSETACVEVAKYLAKHTGKQVKVFNTRDEYKKCASGVEYIPVKELGEYFYRYKPSLHIAWRHAVKLTAAKTYVWGHDLVTPGVEHTDNYDKYIVLSEFHKHYTHDMRKVPLDKMLLWRNGIDPDLWKDVDFSKKNPNKIVFSSSPDRGLDRCIEIVKRAREKNPKLELHLFYGFDNMRKMGMGSDADQLEAFIAAHSDFVKYHGNVSKKELIGHFIESAVWLYPANFIETFCITGLEALASKCYPMVRNMGALPYTLSDALVKGQAWMTDINARDEESFQYWADELVRAVEEERWKRIEFDIQSHSWENVTKELIDKIWQ